MLRELIADQFRKPRGLLGHYAASAMKKRNRKPNDRVIQILNIQNTDKILEIGCGAGLSVKKISELNAQCKIDAIDFSEFMVKKAIRNNQKEIAAQRVKIEMGDIYSVSPNGRAYSKIFAVNVIYFWNDLPRVFDIIHSLLIDGGRLVLFMASPEALDAMPLTVTTIFQKHSLENVKTTLQGSGFKSIESESVLRKGFPAYFIRGLYI